MELIGENFRQSWGEGAKSSRVNALGEGLLAKVLVVHIVRHLLEDLEVRPWIEGEVWVREG